MKKFRNPETIHAPLAGYSHQVELADVKRWLVLSGQVGMLVDGTLPVDAIEHFKVCLDNIQKNIEHGHPWHAR